ncbi:alpha-L-rhamnosidase [Algoriphagus kandeliae]|uniref:alpha-L-rhamnosidase n=1 Tax=Algoriphagus kandeliae TaxID=2562278 RepID=A0A4Y9QVZ0_9BACT|nr:family 78 glycoside hydrolase catalytic domain [Algoriphagus kandeliae]TFV96018.1 alpha-L-rhamnosidase [Algoriphagus kandeliae]
MLKKILVALLITSFLAGSCTTQPTLYLDDLTVEYLEEPLGIDVEKPRFAWKLIDEEYSRGLSQTAYQIVVSDEGQEVWNTGRIENSESLGIEYEGDPLSPTTRYDFSIKIWTSDSREVSQSSWFETGLMNPSIEAWSGASWIGGDEIDLPFYSYALSVFKLGYTVQLDEESGSTKAAMAFGGNDPRLMDKNLNLMGVEVNENESYLSLELDISPLLESQNGRAKVNVYRVGYTEKDSENSPLYAIDIPLSLVNKGNMYQQHSVFADIEFGLLTLYVDGREDQNLLNPKGAGGGFGGNIETYNLNPVGEGNNYISFPMVADIGFQMKPGQKAIFSNYEVTHFRDPSNALVKEPESDETFSAFISSDGFSKSENGLELNGLANGNLLLTNPSKNAAPMLRTTFDTEGKSIKSARVYATARGIYELHVNGKRISSDFFNPGVTQYYKHHLYQTYDITDKLKNGKNSLGAWLGEGWWSGNITYSGNNWNYFGDRQSFLAKIVINYEDGTEDIIITSPETWKVNPNGPIRMGSFFQGEVYDANYEESIEGWSSADYDDSAWKTASIVPLEGTTPSEHDYSNMQLLGQIGRNVAAVDTLIAQSVTEVRPGVFVYDMGQNMVGVPQIQMSETEKGEILNLRYSEVLYPDLDEYGSNVGMVMMENIRAALTTDQWIMKGGADTFQPRFTFHGYRYVEITGMDEALPLEDVKGIVLSSVHDFSSSYESSNELVNRLWQNIRWSMQGNFLSIPTDTPARNERMGWSGDLNVFAEMATYLADIGPFLRRHMIAMRDLQRQNGRFPDVAPVTGGFGGTLWGSAGVKVPWESYQQFGDVKILEENYPAMKAYVDFLMSRTDPDTGVLDEGPLGDWLSPENNKNDNTLLWAAYQVRCLEIVAETAQILGKEEDSRKYEELRTSRKAFFNEKYIDPESHKTIHSGHVGFRFGPPPSESERPKPGDLVDTQASYAIPLAFDVINEEHKPFVVDHLVNAVARKNTDDSGVERPEYSLMTGFIGTASLNEALSSNGHHEEAYRLLQQKTYPSWLYPVINGATTIWERLNSYTIENGFGGNNSMNSFNHYAFGAVGSWMYNYVIGIQRGEPGFKSFTLTPTPDPTGELIWAKGHYDSMYGKIESGWSIEGNKMIYEVTVPANTSATLHLPAISESDITEGGASLDQSKGLKLTGYENGRAIITLGSGKYRFESTYR